MHRLRRTATLAFSFGLFLQPPALAQLDPAAATPPVAKKVPAPHTHHGETLVDDYAWLRDKANPEVIDYLNAENAYSAAVLKPTEPLRAALYKEMVGRIQESDVQAPYRLDGYWYYTRTEQGRQYPVYCRKKGGLEAPEQVTLDLNALAEGHTYIELGTYSVSDDGNLLAYSLDFSGDRNYSLYVKDLRTGRLLPDRAEKVRDAVWATDNRTLFFVTDDDARRPYRLHRHTLGQTDDTVLYEETDALYGIWLERTRDRSYFLLTSMSKTTSEVHYLRADRPKDTPHRLLKREEGHEYYVDHHGDRFFILTNKGAPNFRLVSVPVKDPRPERWLEVLPHRPEVKLEHIDAFAHHLVVTEFQAGLPGLRVIDLKTGKDHRIDVPEPVYDIAPDTNLEFATDTFRFSYQSLLTPPSVFEYDMRSRDRKLLKQEPVLGGYDSTQYTSERIEAIASDGTHIPISLVYKKGLQLDGSNPLLLDGYGAYGIPMTVYFESDRLSLLDRGFIYGMAHVRGGGELGRSWYDQGKLMQKRNTFTDFIAVAETLQARGYTSSKRLVIKGGSAGGLLIGAVLNLRPDLFGAAVMRVPFVDVINSMSDPSIPLTVEEYLEWGNPAVKVEYDYMRSYCPYTNLEAKTYPPMLVKTSLNDTSVGYWEPAKYVAKMRATRTDRNVLLLDVNMTARHSGSSGRYDKLTETALTLAFILNAVGITR